MDQSQQEIQDYKQQETQQYNELQANGMNNWALIEKEFEQIERKRLDILERDDSDAGANCGNFYFEAKQMMKQDVNFPSSLLLLYKIMVLFCFGQFIYFGLCTLVMPTQGMHGIQDFITTNIGTQFLIYWVIEPVYFSVYMQLLGKITISKARQCLVVAIINLCWHILFVVLSYALKSSRQDNFSQINDVIYWIEIALNFIMILITLFLIVRLSEMVSNLKLHPLVKVEPLNVQNANQSRVGLKNNMENIEEEPYDLGNGYNQTKTNEQFITNQNLSPNKISQISNINNLNILSNITNNGKNNNANNINNLTEINLAQSKLDNSNLNQEDSQQVQDLQKQVNPNQQQGFISGIVIKNDDNENENENGDDSQLKDNGNLQNDKVDNNYQLQQQSNNKINERLFQPRQYQPEDENESDYDVDPVHQSHLSEYQRMKNILKNQQRKRKWGRQVTQGQESMQSEVQNNTQSNIAQQGYTQQSQQIKQAIQNNQQ